MSKFKYTKEELIECHRTLWKEISKEFYKIYNSVENNAELIEKDISINSIKEEVIKRLYGEDDEFVCLLEENNNCFCCLISTIYGDEDCTTCPVKWYDDDDFKYGEKTDINSCCPCVDYCSDFYKLTIKRYFDDKDMLKMYSEASLKISKLPLREGFIIYE